MRLIILSSTLFVALLLTACGGGSSTSTVTPEEMNVYIEQHPEMSEFDKACILNGDFKVGMNAETVRFLLGEPNDVQQVTQPWGKQFIWTYKNAGKKIFTLERIANTDNEYGVVGIELD